MSAAQTDSTHKAMPAGRWRFGIRPVAVRQPVLIFCCAVLLLTICMALFAPLLADDPAQLNPIKRLKPPSAEEWFGTDQVGRSVFARVVWGARVSLVIGALVAIATTVVGVVIGVCAGYFRRLDAVIMRTMDAVMAIPSVLLAIALVAMIGSSPLVLVIAISLPEIPRMARMVRANVLVMRAQTYVEAAITCGAGVPWILRHHILPGAAGLILVQATYVLASAMILEAILSFLGAGTPPDVPSWGNMMAEGRQFLQIAPWILLFPAIFLTLIILAVNLLGDAMRDLLDPAASLAVKKTDGM
ncbi:ABC transporter permease [Hoeflea prorocentri]|uniref:ABC transporter permease n=1 Tax=Hoeflea prorocentri TaxID=1922333 RepID=A0A9X3ZHH4_9HYPH|nr:ABC transporter permease [Hoeflea prorocentri]MCY6381837.1 ABC transporter permease [Hoeflea prorocentri]MDA5399637.1 ABC transporter permease [Hoeflea prorocentri]